MKDVSEIMTRNPIVMSGQTTLTECIECFIENSVTTVPVIDAYGELKGVLTELGIIKLYFRTHTNKEVKDQLAFHFDLLEPVAAVPENESINETIKALIKAPTHRVVVQDRQSKIVGILSPKDIIKVLSGDKNRQSRLQREFNEAKESLRKTTGQLHDAEDLFSRYQSYLESAPFLIHSVNEEGKIIMANHRLYEFLGYEPGELVGKSLTDLFDEENAQKALEGLKTLIQTGFHNPVMTAMKRKDGTSVRVEAVSTAMHNSQGKFIGTITMSRRLAADNMLRALNGVLDKDAKPFE